MDTSPEISYTEEIFELIEIILKEQYSKDISDIGKDLLFNGASTIPEIEFRLKLSFESIKNALIVLLQNKYAISKEVLRKDSLVIGYELIVDNVLAILQYPKILTHVSKTFGESALMIFEEFMSFGILSACQIFEQVKSRIDNKKASNVALNKVKVEFLKLIENNYIVQAAKVKGNERKLKENDQKKRNTKGDKTQKDKKNNTRNNSNKKKANNQETPRKIKDFEEEIDKEIEASSKKTNKKSQKVSPKVKTDSVKEDNILIFNKETGKYYYFFFNYNQIISDIKTQIIVDFISQKISASAGLIAARLLAKNSINSYQNGRTLPVSITELIKDLNSISENKIQEIISESNDFFIKPSSDTISLKLEVISKALKDATIDKIVEQQFSMSHVRIFRLLSLCGALDSKNIMDICLILPKNCNLILNQLYSEGFIETQTINLKGSNTLFYFVNRSSVITRLISNCYKIIKNQRLFLSHELDKVKNTVSILMQEQYISKVYTAINEVDDTILVLKDF